ncbi:MAG: 16S rRNA (adenine(1518)-N(6)/adenine(1519)-N(6))-dimethyltransferase RsmA [Coprobacillus sp.]|nr:16S rRNA (adenine(1518)-N(6)/adenine(1519)-N(6))-dimethyltransferase RsmA [Coprobacillus sp.]
MIVDSKTLHNILDETGIVPDKNYGQNFLINPEIARRIVSILDIRPTDKVLEIGPGVGSLTHFFTTLPNDVDVVDVDNNMTTLLSVIYSDDKNIHIINKDARQHDVSTYNKIISNLPYNLTTEILTHLMLGGTSVERMVLTCEAETFNHFVSTSGKDYGPVSILIHLLGTIRKQFTIAPSNFYPSPKCESVVFTIDVDKNVNRSEVVSVYEMTKSLFLNRRKTIYNNLKKYLNNDALATKTLNALDIDPSTRPEQISPNTFLDIYQKIIVG